MTWNTDAAVVDPTATFVQWSSGGIVSGTPWSVWVARPRHRTGMLVTSCVVLVIAARGAVLQGLALPLEYADKLPAATGMLLLGGDGRLDAARQFCVENRDAEVLLVERSPGRLVRLAILAAPHDLERKELIKCGVPGERIRVALRSPTDASLCDVLGRWLQEHPHANLIVVCDSFESRAIRWELDREFTPEIAQRLSIRPLPSQVYGRLNWWHSKRGIMGFVRSWLGLILPVIQRGNSERWQECNPELFQPLLP